MADPFALLMERAWNCNWHTEDVFRLNRPTAAVIKQQVASASKLIPRTPLHLSFANGVAKYRLSFGFARDLSRSRIGEGESAFAAAKKAFARWTPFDLGWVRVANPEALIALGEIVAVEARTLGLWTLNLSRIVEIVDTESRFGFIYETTAMHVEQGEEKFLLEFDSTTCEVWYELEAVSRPRSALARLGFPATRAFQHRFARDSHTRMRQAVEADGMRLVE